ncbi:DedA family protein [Tersicoccus sp. Bi-70]|uniref:DedA family protein n=1 Tax=Tersicoccus sp. Bi-70 TaxID=1897634 RepID=UPI00117C6652|nr:VTT domain-containing protein [Tersicoccus sp. Bi-70]
MDAGSLLQGFGPWVLLGIAVIVFIESGLLFPFLPGDSLLVTAAIVHVSLGLPVWQLVLVASVAAVAGDQAGYLLGRRFGGRWFRPDARVLRTDRLAAATAFFARRGPLALVLGRFVPVVRTYVPLAAGTAGMGYRRFVGWNVLGAVAWVLSMTAVGVLLGGIPGVAHSIDAVMLVIVAMSVLPLVFAAVRRRITSRRQAARQQALAAGDEAA